jgi:hypothetical protein
LTDFGFAAAWNFRAARVLVFAFESWRATGQLSTSSSPDPLLSEIKRSDSNESWV